jgi:MFS family permease
MRFKVDIHFNLKDLKINKVIRALVLADLFFWGGWGIVNPIMALFIIGRVNGATIFTVGAAAAMYWIVKSAFQIPVAIYLDKLEGEKGDFKALVFGLILAGFAAMTFPIISSLWGLFAAVFLQAIAYGLYTPSWSSIFSHRRHYRRIVRFQCGLYSDRTFVVRERRHTHIFSGHSSASRNHAIATPNAGTCAG